MTRHDVSDDQTCHQCWPGMMSALMQKLFTRAQRLYHYNVDQCKHNETNTSSGNLFLSSGSSFTKTYIHLKKYILHWSKFSFYLWCHLRNLNISDNFFSNMALVVIAKLFVLKDIPIHILHPLPKMFIKSLQAFLIRCFCLLVQQHIRCSAWHLDHCTKKQTTTWAAILT